MTINYKDIGDKELLSSNDYNTIKNIINKYKFFTNKVFNSKILCNNLSLIKLIVPKLITTDYKKPILTLETYYKIKSNNKTNYREIFEYIFVNLELFDIIEDDKLIGIIPNWGDLLAQNIINYFDNQNKN